MIKLYPGSANAYDSLGEGYVQKGKLTEALKLFKKAMEIGEKRNDPLLNQYRANYQKTVKKLEMK